MGNVRDRRERVNVYQFLLGSRGEWGYIRPVIEELQKRGRTYEICATNMAVLPEYGNIAKKIRDEGYVVTDMPLMALAGDSRFAMAKSLGVLIQSFVDVLARNKPKWLVLAGDRGEQLAGAIAGSYTYVPTAHIQAGELSGNIDGVARHAIARFAHVHFASNRDASSRLHRFGEQEERIFEVGAPQLDDIANKRYSSREELALLPDLKPLGIHVKRFCGVSLPSNYCHLVEALLFPQSRYSHCVTTTIFNPQRLALLLGAWLFRP